MWFKDTEAVTPSSIVAEMLKISEKIGYTLVTKKVIQLIEKCILTKVRITISTDIRVTKMH